DFLDVGVPVEQQIEALARGELSLFVLAFNLVWATTTAQLGFEPFQICSKFTKARGGLKSGAGLGSFHIQADERRFPHAFEGCYFSESRIVRWVQNSMRE